MASAGVWGAVAQSEGVAQAALKKVESQLSSTEKHGSESTDGSSELPDKERADEEVFKLARKLTQDSVKTVGGTYRNPFANTDDPTLDPLSDQFRPEAWVRTLIG